MRTLYVACCMCLVMSGVALAGDGPKKEVKTKLAEIKKRLSEICAKRKQKDDTKQVNLKQKIDRLKTLAESLRLRQDQVKTKPERVQKVVMKEDAKRPKQTEPDTNRRWKVGLYREKVTSGASSKSFLGPQISWSF